MKRIISTISFLLLLCILVGCTPTAQPAQVVATTLPVFEFATALCDGTDITVTQLITENVSCLHEYTLQVSQMRALESAELVIISGMGLEEFLHDVLENSNAIADSSIGINPICYEKHHDDEEHHDDDHHHDQDPHIWLDPTYAKTMAGNICDALCSYKPEYAPIFTANLAGLINRLDALEEYGNAQLSDLSCRELITFHDGFSYFAQAFDLTIVKAIEEESGSEASAAELIEIAQLVQQHQLPSIFTETNGSRSAASIIAAETGCKIANLDMAMAGDGYFEAMYRNIDTIKEALG